MFFDVAGRKLTRLWHCFGNQHHLCDKATAIDLLRTSGTNVLPINTHNLSTKSGRVGLELGYAGVALDDFSKEFDIANYNLMLNINLQQNTKTAVDKTLYANDITGLDLIKLEVLQRDNVDYSNQGELLEAVRVLTKLRPKLVIVPLLFADYDLASKLVDLGCPAIRIMGAAIASGGGIKNFDEFSKCCKLGIPVIFDGGIGSVDHVVQGMELGTEGFLVNSALFSDPLGPRAKMSEFVTGFKNYIKSKNGIK